MGNSIYSDNLKPECELSSLTVVWELRVVVRGFPSLKKWQSKETPKAQLVLRITLSFAF